MQAAGRAVSLLALAVAAVAVATVAAVAVAALLWMMGWTEFWLLGQACVVVCARVPRLQPLTVSWTQGFRR